MRKAPATTRQRNWTLTYKGYHVFDAQGTSSVLSGYPLFILAGKGTVRRADIHETYDIMGALTQEAR